MVRFGCFSNLFSLLIWKAWHKHHLYLTIIGQYNYYVRRSALVLVYLQMACLTFYLPQYTFIFRMFQKDGATSNFQKIHY